MIERLAIVLGALFACTASSEAAETRSAIAGAERPKVAIAELEWLAGAWEGQGIHAPAHEVYSPVIGGAIIGHFIQQSRDGIAFYELMLIRQDGDSLSYCLKHFNPDLTGWEDKNEVQCFALVACEADAYYFDGLTIRREGPDRMISAVRVDTKEGQRELVFRYRRAYY